MKTYKEFSVQFNRKKLISTISSLFFVTTLFLFFYLLDRDSQNFWGIFDRYITPIILIFLVSELVNFTRKLRGNSSALIINDKGITENISSSFATTIPWSEITDICETGINSERFLTLKIKSPKKFFAQGNLIQRGTKRIKFLFSKNSIHISSTLLDIKLEELRDKIDKYREQYDHT